MRSRPVAGLQIAGFRALCVCFGVCESEHHLGGPVTLLDEINAEDKGVSCRFRALRDLLGPDDAEDLSRAVDSPVSTAAIQRALKARGLLISESGIRRHRRGECSCAAKS